MDSSTDNGTIGCGGSSSSNRSAETPRLCRRGCGFFGTAENRGLCSKCCRDYLQARKENVAAIPPSDQSVINVPIPKELEIGRGEEDSSNCEAVNASVVKKRCGLCNKKVGLLGFECRCGGTFCGTHRYSEAHSCKFDFKKLGKIVIQKQNPLCKPDKITDRV